jgi:uncharacterized protein (TIGR02270 family)
MASVQKPIGFSSHEISSMVNEVVVRQHAENAAFLWTQRDRAVTAPHYRLKDIAKLDERVEANVEGLRVAADFGWKLCEEALEQQGPGEVFAAAVLAFGGNDLNRIERVFEVSQAAPELDRPVVSALGWLEVEQVKNHLAAFVRSENPLRRRMGIAGYAVHRLDPGGTLTQTLTDADSRVRARVLKAAGELGRLDLLSHVGGSIAEDDFGCRFNALWSAVRLGERTADAFRKLEAIMEAGGEFAEAALSLLLRSLPLEEAKQWRRQLRDNPQRLRLATKSIGILGDPGLVPELLVLMEKKEFSRVAGESFSMITGVDLAFQDLERDEPPELKPQEAPNMTGQNVEDLAVEITEDPDANLPWPNPELVSNWWRQHQGEFRVGSRYLCGRQVTSANLMEVIKTGYQRQRAAAAFELALREPRQPLFEVRAPGKQQQQSLGLWSW